MIIIIMHECMNVSPLLLCPFFSHSIQYFHEIRYYLSALSRCVFSRWFNNLDITQLSKISSAIKNVGSFSTISSQISTVSCDENISGGQKTFDDDSYAKGFTKKDLEYYCHYFIHFQLSKFQFLNLWLLSWLLFLIATNVTLKSSVILLSFN